MSKRYHVCCHECRECVEIAEQGLFQFTTQFTDQKFITDFHWFLKKHLKHADRMEFVQGDWGYPDVYPPGGKASAVKPGEAMSLAYVAQWRKIVLNNNPAGDAEHINAIFDAAVKGINKP